MIEATLAMDEEINLWEQRFQFLCRTRDGSGALRYSLHAPDMLEARWNVYDHGSRMTIGFGANGPAAVDCAMKNGSPAEVAHDLLKTI